MRIFVTGATGFIGTATVRELTSHNHQVLGLSRSPASAAILKDLGADIHHGDLEDIEALKAGARLCDAVIHLGFEHDFANMKRCTAIDRAAIEALAEGLGNANNPLVIVSGIFTLPSGAVATEETEPKRDFSFSDRVLSEDLVLRLSQEKNIRGAVVRLAPTIHGAGDKGFVTMLIDAARRNGFVTYVGEGQARWPTAHRADAAVLFRLILENGERTGAIYHGVAEEGVVIKDVMTLIGKKLSLPVESKTGDEAVQVLGMFGRLIDADNPTSSDKTRVELGWKPTQPGLLEDMDANYFS